MNENGANNFNNSEIKPEELCGHMSRAHWNSTARHSQDPDCRPG